MTAMLTRPELVCDDLEDLWDGPEPDPDPTYVDPEQVWRVMHPHDHGCADAWRGLAPAVREEVVRQGLTRRVPLTSGVLAQLLHVSGDSINTIVDRVRNPEPAPHRPGLPVLTVRRPWASLIVDGAKPAENRAWTTPYRGTLLIHAGLRWVAPAVRLANSLGVTVPPDRAHPAGVIVGCVDLVGMCNGSATCRCGPWAIPGCWHWQLTNPRRFARPVPWVGQQSLRWTDPDTTRLVEELRNA